MLKQQKYKKKAQRKQQLDVLPWSLSTVSFNRNFKETLHTEKGASVHKLKTKNK